MPEASSTFSPRPVSWLSSTLYVWPAMKPVLSSSTRATRADGFFVTEQSVEADQTVEVIPYPVVE